MTSFYIVPPRKTQLGDNGISISGTLGVITTNPGGAAITGVGALRLDTTYSPTWTGTHTFTQPIIFSGSQTISSTLISASGQTAGDLFYYTGTSWSRLAVGSNNQILQSFGGGIGWTGGVNLTNVITGNLKIGSLSGVLKASSGVVSGNSGIGDLSNVLLNLPASGNFLKYNGTNWVNSPIPLSDHNIIIRFLNGYTPVQTGIDIEVATVPYEPSDGTTVLEYTITRIVLQVEIAGSTSSQVTIERALNGQEFDDPMTLGNTIETLILTSGSYQASSNGPFFKIYSGERLRLNINSIGTGAQQWTVQIEGTAGNPYNGTNAGITSINSLAAQLQTMVVGSGGTDFNISSVIDTHTFNIPSASGSNRGLVTTTNQTFAGIKTFNNTSVTTSTTTGSVIISGGVGIGESIYIGGNVLVENNLILNNALGLTYGGTGLTTIGESNTFLAVNNAGSSLEYKKLIAGTGITFNFSGSEIILESTGGTGITGLVSGGGISSLNGISYINYPEQSFAVGSSGTDFNIVSIGSTHTFNLPEAGSGASGIVTTNSQTFAGIKTFNDNLVALSDLNVNGSSNLTSAVGVSSGVNISGGLGVTGASILRSTLQVSGIATIINNTSASSTTTGALVVSGGVGISGSLFVGSGANISSNNTSSITTSSGLVFSANSLTTGTGAYFASNSLTTGKLLDIAVSGNTAIGARIGLNVTMSGVNANPGVTTYGIFTNNTSTNTAVTIGLGAFANGDSYNIPLRLGLSTAKYINFFINSDGTGLTLSPTATGTPFLALGGYAGTTAELRLLQSGGFGSPKYVALKAPDTVANTYDLIFPNSYPASSNMALVGTGTTQVTLSWSSLSSGGIGGTVNAGDQYKLAFYVNPNGSSILDDAQALTYSTSGANLTINSTAASVVPLKLVGAVSQTADLLQVATSSSNIFTIDKDGIGSFTNNLIISSNTSSTSSSTGALTVTGGLGVQGRISTGSGISVAGDANFASNVEINSLKLLNNLSLNYGGTGLGTSGLPNQILGMNNTSSSLEYKTLNVGFGITISHSANSVTFAVTNSGNGISSINGLTTPEQTFATSSSGTNFNIVSIGSTHTFNMPSAGSGSSGIITTAAQTISGDKSFTDVIVASGLGISNTATFRSTVDIYSGLGVTGSTNLRNTLSVSGIANFTNNTNSSSTTNGSVIVSGGIGIGGTVYTNNLYVLGTTTLFNPLSVTNGGTGSNNGSITGTGALTFTAGGTNTNINLVPNGNGTVDVSSKRITNLATPTGALDAVNKVYVDQIAQGINYHDHVEAATTAGLGATYQNGVLGVGATLQASPSAGWSTSYSDGVLLSLGDRVLVKNQSGTGVTVQNGIYVVSQLTSPWILTRSSDYDNSISGSVGPGDTVWVAFGNTLQYTTWTQSSFGTGDSSGGVLIGTDPITYVQTSGAGSYNGDGSTIDISGSIISIHPSYVGQTSITTLGTITSGIWNASVIGVQYGGTGASSFISNGALYGNGSSAIQATSASSAVGAILTTASSGGAPAFSNTLQGQYVISNNQNSTSSTSGALSVTGGVGVSGNIFAGSNININNAANIGSGLGVSGNTNISGGLGVTGSSLFRSSVVIQDGGLGVTGATLLNSSLTVSGSSVLNSTLNVIGNVNFASAFNVGGASNVAGLGVSANLNITGGLGITGKSLFRDSVIIQSGGLGVSGGLVITQGGLGVTGATTLRSTLSVLGTASFETINQGTWNGSAIGLSYGGTGLGTSGTANQMLGMSNDSSGLEYKTLIAGSNVTILNSTNSITISSSSGGGGGSGVVNTGLATQVAYYAVGGTSVSGTSNLTVGSSGVGISFATQSTSSTSGALVVAGGMGVSGNVRIGSGLGVSGALNFVSGTFGNVGSSTFTLNFLSSGNSPISLNVLSDNSLSFEGSSGQLLAISNNLSTGFIYSINNISGLPLLRANANGNVSMGEFAGNIGVGISNPQFKLHVIGDTNVTGGFGVSGLANVSGGLGVTGYTNLSSTLIVQGNAGIVGGLGVTGQSVFRNNVEIQSGGLGVTGAVNITSTLGVQGSGNFSGGLGVTGAVNVSSTLGVQGSGNFSSGLGVTGTSLFRGNIEIQSGGLGVTGAVNISSNLGVQGSGNFGSGLGVTGAVNFTSTLGVQGSGNFGSGLGVTGTSLFRGNVAFNSGLGVTGQSVFRNNVEIQSGGLGVTGAISSDGIIIRTGGLGVTGQSVFRNNIEIQSGGIGVTGGVTITGSGLTIISGGIGVTGQSVFRNNIEIQSGGLGVTGGIGVTGRLTIHAGGLGVTGAAVFNSSISAGSLSLSTPLPLSSGGTGLGSTSLANYILGMNSSSLGLEYKQIVEGSNITITHNTNSITIAAASSSSTPGGPNSAIQYNGSNTLAGTSAFLWDNSSQRIDIKNTNAIGTGTTTGFLLQNSTASTVSVQMQFSPGIEFVGRAWKTSGSPATDTLVRYLEMVEVTSGGTPTGAITWKSAIHNASNQGPTYVKRAEISTNYGLGIYETTGVYKSSIINSASATTDIYYTLPAALPSLNQSLAVTGISVSSVTLSWISSGTVASGASGALAYYAGAGTTVDDATGLAYASSGTHLVITSQTATDVPLRVDGHASSSVNLFQVRKGTNDQLVVNSSGNVSISSTQASTGASTGALVVAGDVGVGGTVFTNGLNIQNILTLGSQIFYPQTTRGFSVNENFNPVGSGVSHTGYHFASGVGRTSIYFDLAITNQYTVMFGTYGLSSSNTFVIGSETANSDFEFRNTLGIQPVRLDLGTLLMRINRNGNVFIPASTGSTSTSTGALVVAGGVGIGQSLYVGGNLYQNSNAITAYDTGFRNRIINGDGNIDQRNSGTDTTPASTANFIDRWKMNIFGSGRLTIGKNYGGVAAPDGFVSYIGMKTTTTTTPGANDYNFLSQIIEGVNTIDLQWGSANAKPITLSFWAYSSLTGTFGGSVRNAGSGGYTRSYPFTYTISSSNTWEKKTIVIPGDTTGTWTTSQINGLEIIFVISNGTTWQATPFAWVGANATGPSGSLVNLIGTLNATLYLTGIQAEIGSVATPYERRNYGHEFALCQRYYQITEVRTGGYHTTGGELRGSGYLNAAMRPITSPIVTVLATDESGNLGTLNVDGSNFRGDSFRYIVAVTTTGTAYGQWKVSCDTEF